ncbi:hypothetical protein PS3A_36390 [Pseudomonas sp. 3A(2025)]
MSFSDLPPGSTVQPCSAVVPSPVYWIEIELLGENDQPIPWEAYEVRLPDGQCVPGFLDGEGFTRFDNLQSAGACEVRFPNLDKDAWEKLETRTAKEQP